MAYVSSAAHQRRNHKGVFRVKQGLLASILLAASGLSPAEVINNGDFLTDTETKLDWLDVTATQNLTMNEVLALTGPGGSLEGWRYATEIELNTLLNNLELPYADPNKVPGDAYNENYPTESEEVEDVIHLLGDTYKYYTIHINPTAPQIVADDGAGFTWGFYEHTNFGIQRARVLDAERIYRSTGADCCNEDDHAYVYRPFDAVNPNFRNDRTGSFLVRDSVAIPEICDNGIDDDDDGLVDGADPECIEGVGLRIRCLHEPIHPNPGDLVNIVAEPLDGNAESVIANTIEIFVDDMAAPAASFSNAAGGTFGFTATGESFGYGCSTERDSHPYGEDAVSWKLDEPVLRTVMIGPRDPNSFVRAVPIMLNGGIDEKIDIVFFPDDSEYTGFDDPEFLEDVYDLIYEGYFTIPWFVSFQYVFNFWIGTDNTANASPSDPDNSSSRCKRDAPELFGLYWSFADSAAIVHTQACRDNAGSPGIFTVEIDAKRMQVVAHETGHRPFGLADEYCCDGGYFTSKRPLLSSEYKPPAPNLYKNEDRCVDDAANRWYDAYQCRPLVDIDTGEDWWIGEPYFKDLEPNKVDQVRDLMQQTGGTTNAAGVVLDRYKVGDSERDRMSWWLNQCVNREC